MNLTAVVGNIWLAAGFVTAQLVNPGGFTLLLAAVAVGWGAFLILRSLKEAA